MDFLNRSGKYGPYYQHQIDIILLRFWDPIDLHRQGDCWGQKHLHTAGTHRQDQGAILHQVSHNPIPPDLSLSKTNWTIDG